MRNGISYCVELDFSNQNCPKEQKMMNKVYKSVLVLSVSNFDLQCVENYLFWETIMNFHSHRCFIHK